MTKEENRKLFDALSNTEAALNDKVKDTMLMIIRLQDTENAGFEVFHHLKETYSVDELALIASLHIGNELKDAVENSEVLRTAASMIRHLDNKSKEAKGNG